LRRWGVSRQARQPDLFACTCGAAQVGAEKTRSQPALVLAQGKKLDIASHLATSVACYLAA